MARDRKFSTLELFQNTKQILLIQGYEGFTFSLLAEQMKLSRGALYKYYENKDELITDYMVYEMEHFLNELKKMESYLGFEKQFEFLLDIIFNHSKTHHILGFAKQIPMNKNKKIKKNKEQLNKFHLDMYRYLQEFIHLGREEQKIKSHLADSIILGFIFQSIAIPNHTGIPQSEWVKSIKEILRHGMFQTIN